MNMYINSIFLHTYMKLFKSMGRCLPDFDMSQITWQLVTGHRPGHKTDQGNNLIVFEGFVLKPFIILHSLLLQFMLPLHYSFDSSFHAFWTEKVQNFQVTDKKGMLRGLVKESFLK